MNITIKLLADCPEALSTLARWYYDEWDKNRPNWTLQSVLDYSARQLVNRDQIPLTLVAFYDDDIAGCIDISETEFVSTQKEYGPWLADLIIAPKFRNTEVKEKLITAAKNKAKELGHKEIYTCRPYKGLRSEKYNDTGWKCVDRGIDSDLNLDLVVLKYGLTT